MGNVHINLSLMQVWETTVAIKKQ